MGHAMSLHYGMMAHVMIVLSAGKSNYRVLNWLCTNVHMLNNINHIVLLRFSKSGTRTVSDGFMKKSADSDSVSDSWGRHYKLIYTGRRRAQRLSTGVRQMRRRCTSQAIVRGRQDATTGQRAVCPTHRTHVDVRRPTRYNAIHWRTSLHNAKTTCHPPWGSILQYILDGMHWVL